MLCAYRYLTFWMENRSCACWRMASSRSRLSDWKKKSSPAWLMWCDSFSMEIPSELPEWRRPTTTRRVRMLSFRLFFASSEWQIHLLFSAYQPFLVCAEDKMYWWMYELWVSGKSLIVFWQYLITTATADVCINQRHMTSMADHQHVSIMMSVSRLSLLPFAPIFAVLTAMTWLCHVLGLHVMVLAVSGPDLEHAAFCCHFTCISRQTSIMNSSNWTLRKTCTVVCLC